MNKDIYHILSGAVRRVLREQNFAPSHSKAAQNRLKCARLVALCQRTTETEIEKVEALIIDNHFNGWDDVLYRRCPPACMNKPLF